MEDMNVMMNETSMENEAVPTDSEESVEHSDDDGAEK